MSDASLTSTQIGSPIFSSTPMRPKSPTFTSTVAVRPKSPVAVVTSTVVDSGIGASAVTTTTTAAAAAAEPNDGGKETEPDPTEPLDGTIFSVISETPEPLEPLPTTRIVPRKKRKTMSQKAGLTLNVRRVYNYLKAGKYAKRVREKIHTVWLI